MATTKRLSSDTDLAGMFGIDLDSSADTAPAAPDRILCPKCHGRGNFIGYTGRVVGKCFTCAGTGISPKAGEPVVTIANFTGVVALFGIAQSRLKHPKIRLQLPDGRPVCLSVAGPGSRSPGSINVTDGGRFGANVWYGRVAPDGTWDASTRTDRDTAVALAVLLTELAGKPAQVAARYGRQTGSCCFCALPLTDKRSVAVGYGPVCADKYSLPWSEAAPLTCQET